jgi:hypothetical protein
MPFTNDLCRKKLATAAGVSIHKNLKSNISGT